MNSAVNVFACFRLAPVRLLFEQRCVRVSAGAPFAVGDVSQAGGHQHERGLAVGERADNAGAATHFPVEVLDRVVRADVPPMLAGHLAVRERLGEAFAHGLGGRSLVRLHCMDGLEHGSNLGALGFGDLGEDIAVEMHCAALVFCLREHLGDRADHAAGLVADDHANAAQPARSQPRQEIAPALGRRREALGAPDHLAAAVLVHADCHHDRHVLVGAAPAALEVDAVHVDVRIGAVQRPTPPLIDRFERLVVGVGHRAGGDARVPQDPADVLDAPRRRPGQVHLDDGLLDAGLAPLVALDDRGGEAHALEAWAS